MGTLRGKTLKKIADFDYELAKLKLLFIKENFEYQKFFKEFRKNPPLFCPGPTIKPSELFVDGHVFGRTEEDKKIKITPREKTGPFFDDYLEIFGMDSENLRSIYDRVPYVTVMDILDPIESLDEIPKKDLTLFLRKAFKRSFQKVYPLPRNCTTSLEPGEVVFKVDTRNRKADIMAEFEFWIDSFALREHFVDHTRARKKEMKQYLEIWRLRKERRKFSEIAHVLQITKDTAKKGFYRAFELTQKQPYDRNLFSPHIKVTMETLCSDCPNRKICNILCPDALRFISQDQKPQREKLLREDTDQYKDYLLNNFSE